MKLYLRHLALEIQVIKKNNNTIKKFPTFPNKAITLEKIGKNWPRMVKRSPAAHRTQPSILSC